MELNVESVIGNHHQVFRLPREEGREIRHKLLRDAFEFHYNHNTYYRNICEAKEIKPEYIGNYQDLKLIPLIPPKMFKQADSEPLLSVPLEEIELEFRSSGTTGTTSVSGRDRITTSRGALGSLAMYREFFQLSSGAGLFLCPSPAEMPQLGMAKALSVLKALLDEQGYPVEGYIFRPEEAVSLLQEWQGKHTRHIIGPPFLIYRLIEYLEKNSLHILLDQGSKLITLGGWKRFSGEQIPRERFDRLVIDRLGIAEHQIRDMYGTMEVNMLAVECDHHRKHVPPWCYISLRDADDFDQEVGVGKIGVVGILDSACHSYPGFILTEDVGRILRDGTCKCGRVGQVLEHERRLEGAELDRCALVLERYLQIRE